MKTALNFSLKNNLLKNEEHNLIINHIGNSNLVDQYSKGKHKIHSANALFIFL